MVIPSNDAFFANLSQRAYPLFNRWGAFIRPITIDLYGRDVYDAGSEVNNPQGGAAFSTEGGTSQDENGVIHRHEGLDEFVETGLPTGEKLQSAFLPQTPLARITVSFASDPSLPIDHRGPEATLRAETLSEGGGASYEIDVIYTDPSGVNVSSLDPTDLRIARYNGPSALRSRAFLQPTEVTTDAPAGTSPRTVVATYRIPAPGGTFGPEDNGRYHVLLNSEQVDDAPGNSSRFQRLGGFNVEIATPAVKLQIRIENLSPSGGLFSTPFWVGVHNGRFDIGSPGRPASQFPGLELLAEEGDTSEISRRFQATANGVDATIVSPGGFPGAPVFDPGETVNFELHVANPQEQRYFSFASMVIPSNDAFLANLSRRAHRLFDRSGSFVRPVTINLFGRDVYDAGTEVNNPQGGAAFSTEERNVARRKWRNPQPSRTERLRRNRSPHRRESTVGIPSRHAAG